MEFSKYSTVFINNLHNINFSILSAIVFGKDRTALLHFSIEFFAKTFDRVFKIRNFSSKMAEINILWSTLFRIVRSIDLETTDADSVNSARQS